MKILHIIPSMDPSTGGLSEFVRTQSLSLIKLDNLVEVVCLDDPDSEYLKECPLQIHALGKGQNRWSYHPHLKPWLRTNLSRFDRIILNGLWQYPGYLLAKLSNSAEVPPYFIYPHGMLDPWFQSTRTRRFKAFRNYFYWKFVEKQTIQKASAICFTCSEELRLAQNTFRPYRPAREIDVGFGIASPAARNPAMRTAFAEKCPGLADRPYFIFLGRIHPKKGVDLLIAAYGEFCRLNAESAEPGLVIAGPGLDSPFGQQMKKLASTNCAPDSVFFPGMLSGNAKWGALYGAEAFALFSHQENFGIAVVEALACEIPVLISNQINIWREIKNAGAGIVGDDTPAGAKNIFGQWAGLTSSNKSQFKKAAKECFARHFEIESSSRRLLSAFSSISFGVKSAKAVS